MKEVEAHRVGKKGPFIERAPAQFVEEMQRLEKWELDFKVGQLEGEVDMFYQYEFPKEAV